VTPALLAVAHGSPDPRGAPAMAALVAAVAARLPGVEVQLGWLEHGTPALPEAVAALGGDAVVVPLLLSRGYHSGVDLPRAVRGRRVAPVLGPDPLLATALHRRLRAAGVPDDRPVVLGAAGTSDPAGQQDVHDAARLLQALRSGPVTAAFATAAEPRLTEMPRDVPVAAYVLAAGIFADRLGAATGPLCDAEEVPELVVRRYLAARDG
jgi:sirohydrochlorin ferrochelatase